MSFALKIEVEQDKAREWVKKSQYAANEALFITRKQLDFWDTNHPSRDDESIRGGAMVVHTYFNRVDDLLTMSGEGNVASNSNFDVWSFRDEQDQVHTVELLSEENWQMFHADLTFEMLKLIENSAPSRKCAYVDVDGDSISYRASGGVSFVDILPDRESRRSLLPGERDVWGGELRTETEQFPTFWSEKSFNSRIVRQRHIESMLRTNKNIYEGKSIYKRSVIRMGHWAAVASRLTDTFLNGDDFWNEWSGGNERASYSHSIEELLEGGNNQRRSGFKMQDFYNRFMRMWQENGVMPQRPPEEGKER